MALQIGKIYPTSAETVPQPIAFQVLYNGSVTSPPVIRFISSVVQISLKPGTGFDDGMYLEIPVLGLPSAGNNPGILSTAPTSVQPPFPLFPPYHYVRVKTVVEYLWMGNPLELTDYTGIDSFIVGESAPTLVSPLDGAINQSINTDWLKEMIYDDVDAESYSAYTVYFSFDGGFSFYAQDDRSRYSILSYKMWLGVTLDYSTTYYWFVRKEVDEEITDSDVWAFTTIDYQPPALRTRQKIPYGGGAPITVPTGENNMMSINRLIVAGDNTIFYEDV